MPLNSRQRQFLKGEAHSLNPVVLLGNDGITEGVLKELDSSLEHHELLKVRVNAGDSRKEQAQELADAVGAELVQVIGRIAVLFRQRKQDSRFVLPR
ncbi:MAG: ribosome assembly RNA-binding protein YhbY [Proteobacteria bacterium]|uniref:Ribosome assembly RNA-binding protein YhbY n=1 Tax=Candidatus Avisuccinivibrio stercorigallinarum TaxID=2840704 RepID=A0A9D9GSE9_9GAMM|nr:ribosome assembly RNA-binding protein YhbY [Candidatus Avisuccinivibrio stercorigallinarum]